MDAHRVALFLFAVLMIGVITVAPAARGPAAFADSLNFDRDIAPAQGLLMVDQANGNTEDMGSAFCIASDPSGAYYLTANHVVSKGRSASYRIARYNPTRDVFNATLAAAGDKVRDLAVLRIGKPCEKVMMLDPKTRTRLANFVVVGFPDSLTALLPTIGIDGPSATFGHVATPINNGNFLQLDAGIVDHGSSGGPIYDPVSGMVIGMVVTKDGHPDVKIDYAIAVSPMILPFLKSHGIAFSVPAVSPDINAAGIHLSQAGNFAGSAPFGQRPLTCNYAVDLTTRRFDVAITGREVTSATLMVHMKETADPDCPLRPIGENDQLFDFTSGTLSEKGVDIAFSGRQNNQARSNAVFHGTFTSRTTLDGELTFLRSGYQGTPFDWTVRISILLTQPGQ